MEKDKEVKRLKTKCNALLDKLKATANALKERDNAVKQSESKIKQLEIRAKELENRAKELEGELRKLEARKEEASSQTAGSVTSVGGEADAAAGETAHGYFFKVFCFVMETLIQDDLFISMKKVTANTARYNYVRIADLTGVVEEITNENYVKTFFDNCVVFGLLPTDEDGKVAFTHTINRKATRVARVDKEIIAHVKSGMRERAAPGGVAVKSEATAWFRLT